VERTHTVCDGPDAVVDVVLEAGPHGPIAFLALWRPTALLDGRWHPAGASLVAVNPETGAVIARAALPGVPIQLLLAPAPAGAERRLYCLTGPPGAESGDPSSGHDASTGGRWGLVAFDAASLVPEREYPLPHALAALAVAPDGLGAYGLAQPGANRVVHLDLVTGGARPAGTLPGHASALAVTAARVYAPDSAGNEVWTLDRRAGTLMPPIPVGRRPIGLALAAAS
jgi:hypothetical protein